ncbi:MAG: tyrosine--tRNA ligase [Pseudomonadales bacterium]
MQQTRENLIQEFVWRGLVSQISNEDKLATYLSEARSVYCGFDPTADSLHIGSLVPLLALRRFQLAGHRPILLLGGATGLIGDPSGRDDERNLNQQDTVGQWVEKLRAQVGRFLDFDGANAAIVCNNLDWTRQLDVISFLRDIGKHFSVNAMVQRDSVKARLEREDQGISYTEFSYMLLQAMDFLELAKREDCLLQIGGSDQWGNIVSGIDLIRRHTGQEAFALTMPLVTKSDGSKFGKTASGAVWLDPNKTSPYSFYQFWFNSADADIEKFLKLFTFMDEAEIADLVARSQQAPEQRLAQRELARQVTELVHGDDAVTSAERISASLFGGDEASLQREDLKQLQLDGLPSIAVSPGDGLLNTMVAVGAAKSSGEARKLIQGRGVRLNGSQVEDPKLAVVFDDAYFGEFFLLRKGKKQHYLLVKS